MIPKRIFPATRGRRSCLVAVMALMGTLAPAVGNATEACHRTTDEKSVYMRALQTDLMVAALTCSDSDKYNSFIHQFQPVLIQDSKRLQAYYKKRNGKAGTEELNTFVTHLANDESERSIQEGQVAYCDNANKIFQSVTSLQGEQLEDFATQIPISADAPVKPCAAASVSASAVVGTTVQAPAVPAASAK